MNAVLGFHTMANYTLEVVFYVSPQGDNDHSYFGFRTRYQLFLIVQPVHYL